jgi:ABC-type bacteriocin/lantibiotic exporter with double-glycine peptidase domain
MSQRSTTATADPLNLLSDALTRASTLLTRDTGADAATEDPLTRALTISAAQLGKAPAPGHVQRKGEPLGDALARICRASDLLVRKVSIGDGETFAAPCPLIAVRKSDRAPVSIIAKGKGWVAVDPQSGAKTRFADSIDDLETTAYMIYPAFPQRKMSPLDLVMFGLYPARVEIACFFILTLLTGILAATIPMASQWVIADIVPGHETALLAQIVILLVLLFGANLATRLATSLARLRIDGRTGSMLRFAAADRCVRLCAIEEHAPPAPVAAFSARSMATWHQGIWHLVLMIAATVLMAAPSLLVVASSAPLAALLVLVSVLAAIGAAYWISRQQYLTMMKGRAGPMSWMVSAFETLSEIETVRTYAVEQRFFARWSESFLSLREKFLRGDRIACGTHAITAALEATLILVAITAIYVLHTNSTSAETVAFVMAVSTVAGTSAALIGAFSNVSMLALQKRLITPLLEGSTTPSHSGVQPSTVGGTISVDEVSYRHNEDGPLVIDRVSLEIKPGEHIGIAGPSGAGKSTLMNLMLGLVKPESGHVLFDGVDLTQIDGAALRRQIGVVGQSGRLFPGSLFDNIALGADITHTQALEAVHQAGLGDDIAAMPLGLSTPIGDANPSLSGGQIQRILMARAFASKPKLIVLDEATSALDPAAQRHVQASLDHSKASIISIAHRLETLRKCDRIYVLDAGSVAECGSYDDLINAGGLFARMVETEQSALAPAPNPAQEALDRILREFSL